MLTATAAFCGRASLRGRDQGTYQKIFGLFLARFRNSLSYFSKSSLRATTSRAAKPMEVNMANNSGWPLSSAARLNISSSGLVFFNAASRPYRKRF